MLVAMACISDIPANDVRSFDHNGERIAIYNCDGKFYATAAICTHSYYDLGDGGFVDPDDCTIECPMHGARFDLVTGAVRALPAYGPLTVYTVQVEGERILIDIPDV